MLSTKCSVNPVCNIS